jgi:diguanylate cyclase (GGDEF)-like protein
MAGECLCGKSLARKELIYSGCVDSDHDIQFDGMPQHGHYCVPLILEDEVLGILTVYLKHGHKENEKEKEWLRMIAATIAKSLHCKGVNEKFKFCATHDQLTSLPNKLLLFDRLTQMMLNADRYQTKLVILFMDLNKFKKVNDILGHKAGDEVLVQAAERLLSVSRKSDTVSRVGGDEFIIACSMNDISGLQQICNTIKSSIKHPMILNNGSIVNIDISIGASIYPDHGNSLEKLIKIADECMYISKKEKLNYWLFSL